MKIWTDEPVGTVDPTEGWVPLTMLLGLPGHTRDAEPGRSAATLVACDTVSPMTLGTCVVGGPVETLTVTVEP